MQDNLYNKQIETISNEELKKLQYNKFTNTLHIAKYGSKFYKGLFNKIDIGKFRNINDIHNLPFTSKHDLVNLSTYDNLACDIDDLLEVHFSSGTTNNPIPSFMTEQDLKKSTQFLARTWYMQGVRSNTILCMLAYYGLFSAGLLNHYAIQHLNAFVIPASSNSTDKTINLFKYFKVDTTAAVASYYLYLIEKMKQLDIDPIVFNLKQVILGGEPFTEDQRHYIENSLNAEVFDQYGLCEINTGLAGECKYHSGLHILADYAYPEIINPETLELCKEGEIGELVLTTLEKEASPLIRYRTGDMTYINYERCKCGRTMPRIGRILKRSTNKIFYKGIKIEKESIHEFMVSNKTVINPLLWQFYFDGKALNQTLQVKVRYITADIEQIESFNKALKAILNFNFEIIEFSNDDLTALESKKLINFIDNRKL